MSFEEERVIRVKYHDNILTGVAGAYTTFGAVKTERGASQRGRIHCMYTVNTFFYGTHLYNN